MYGVCDPKTGRHYGYGLRCKLNGRRAILTALHVIEEAKKEPLGLAISTGYGERPYVVRGESISTRLPTWPSTFYPRITLVPTSASGRPAQVDHLWDKLATDYLFLHGFPGKASYPSRLLGGVFSTSLPYGAMQRLEKLPPNLQPFQFAVEYDPAGMKNETGAARDLVDPHGLCGSPVWRIGVSGRLRRNGSQVIACSWGS